MDGEERDSEFFSEWQQKRYWYFTKLGVVIISLVVISFALYLWSIL